MRRTAALATPVAALLLLAGCSSDASTPADPSAGSGGDGATGTLTVFAAASLRTAFAEIGTRYEAAHPGMTVRFTFAGSSDLVTQVGQGAPGDVLATADTTTMGRAVEAGVVAGDPTTFATNTLEIVTAPGNPRGITSLADLASPDLAVVVCAPQVPCGSASATVEQAAGTELSPVSEESSVTDVLTKVTSGQADAGLVYVTDVAQAGDAVTGVAIPQASAAVNTYPVAALSGSALPARAAELVAFVAGPEGRAVLADEGFGAP